MPNAALSSSEMILESNKIKIINSVLEIVLWQMIFQLIGLTLYFIFNSISVTRCIIAAEVIFRSWSIFDSL